MYRKVPFKTKIPASKCDLLNSILRLRKDKKKEILSGECKCRWNDGCEQECKDNYRFCS